MEDTKTKDEIEQTLRTGGKQADEPGEDLGKIIQRGDEDKDVPEVGPMKVTSAGYTNVYDTLTGIDSRVNNNHLRKVLNKKRPDGSYAFSLTQRVKPIVGTFKCFLHKDTPNREIYDTMGLAVCSKDNLASEYQRRRHMEKRHKAEWAAIEQMRVEVEKKEDRDFQKLIISKAVGGIEEPERELYISDKDRAKNK